MTAAKNGVPAIAPSIRASRADSPRNCSAIIAGGSFGRLCRVACAHSSDGGPSFSIVCSVNRSATCSGSRYTTRASLPASDSALLTWPKGLTAPSAPGAATRRAQAARPSARARGRSVLPRRSARRRSQSTELPKGLSYGRGRARRAGESGVSAVNHRVDPQPSPHEARQMAWHATAEHVVPTSLRPEGRAVNSGLAIVGLTLLLVAAVSRRLSSTPVTPAMVVTAIGVLVGPLVLDDLSVRPTSSTVRTLAEATLAVVLFSDSSRVDLRALRREASMPVRLLGVGLPLTVVLGGLVAVLLFGSFSLSEAVILGVILAPRPLRGRFPCRLGLSRCSSTHSGGRCRPYLLAG